MTILAVIWNTDEGQGGKNGNKRWVRRFGLADKELSHWRLWREPCLSVMGTKACNARGHERTAKKGTLGQWQNCWEFRMLCWEFRMLCSISDVCHEYRMQKWWYVCKYDTDLLFLCQDIWWLIPYSLYTYWCYHLFGLLINSSFKIWEILQCPERMLDVLKRYHISQHN